MDKLVILFGSIGGGILVAVLAGVIVSYIEKKKNRSKSHTNDDNGKR